jgi:hypothetical protein
MVAADFCSTRVSVLFIRTRQCQLQLAQSVLGGLRRRAFLGQPVRREGTGALTPRVLHSCGGASM